MEGQTKVACLECKRKYYVDSADVPDDAQKGEAFQSDCPHCDEGTYAELAD